MPDEFILTPTSLVYGGDALARLPDGRACFIPFCLPGEEVRVRLVEEKRGHAMAELIEVITPSPMRITPRCRHFGVCGGCHYQHMEYAEQIKFKSTAFSEQLQHIGGLVNPPLRPLVPSPSPWNYRNTIQFHLSDSGRLGFQKAGSHQLVEIEECHLPLPEIDTAWHSAQFDAIPGLERVEFRQGTDGDVLVSFEGAPETLPEIELDAPYSLVHLTQGGSVVMAGDDHVIYEVSGKVYQVSAGGFFQVNLPVAESMIHHLLSELTVTRQSRVLDVYCGVGLFSKAFAPLAAHVTGIELDATACQDFAVNLDEFDNVTLYQAKAGLALAELKEKFDIVILDPPRAGLEPFTITTLLKMKSEHIAYVSCDPATLSRDLKLLLAGGYHLRSITPFDLFPQTYHLESISLLQWGSR